MYKEKQELVKRESEEKRGERAREEGWRDKQGVRDGSGRKHRVKTLEQGEREL